MVYKTTEDTIEMTSPYNQTVTGWYPEPQPDWAVAIPMWGWGWYAHIYGFGSLFTALVVYDVLILLVLNKRLRSQPFVLGVFITVFMFCCIKMMYLLMDPYGSDGVLSVTAVEAFHGLTFPSLATMLGALEITILGMTKGSIGIRKSRTQRFFCLYVFLHFVFSVVTYVCASVDSKLHLLIMLSQGIYVTFGLILCFIFTYNGYRVTEFTSETNRLLKQINLYSKVRKEAKQGGNQRELSLMRISKSRMVESTALDVRSDGQYDSGAESSDNLSLYQEAIKELVIQKESDKTGTNTGIEAEDCLSALQENRYTFNGSHLSLDLSSESDYVTEGPSPSPVAEVMSPEQQRYCSKTDKGKAIISPTISDKVKHFFKTRKKRRSVNGCRMSFTKVPSEASRYVNGQINSAFDKDSQCGSQLLRDAAVENNDPPSRPNGPDGNTPVDDPSAEDAQDGGYMADTEVTSPREKKTKGRKGKKTTNPDDEDSESNQTVNTSFPLPVYTGYLGLHRIRQGRVLRKVHKVTYMAVVCVFCTCILQVYAMFGDLGVLSKQKVAEPWPWFIFHSLSRFMEVAAAGVMTVVAHRLGSQRYRTRRKQRDHRGTMESQTRC